MYFTVLLLDILIANYKLLFTLGSMTFSEARELVICVTVKFLGFKKFC